MKEKQRGKKREKEELIKMEIKSHMENLQEEVTNTLATHYLIHIDKYKHRYKHKTHTYFHMMRAHLSRSPSGYDHYQKSKKKKRNAIMCYCTDKYSLQCNEKEVKYMQDTRYNTI